MGAVYRQEGCAIDYTPAVAVAAGDIVFQGGLAGFAKTAIAANALGALTTEGVITIEKDSNAIVIGSKVYWDATNLRVSRDPSVGNYLGRAIEAATGGAATVRVLVTPNEAGGRMLALAAEAASTALTNSVTETNFDNSALTIPANSLNLGDVIRVRAQGICTATNSTDTFTGRIKLGSTTVLTTGAVDVANNDIFYLEGDIVIRTIGASGTAVASGLIALGAAGTATARPQFMASTTVDTTAAITAAVSGQWSVANAGNSCRLDVCNWQILRKA